MTRLSSVVAWIAVSGCGSSTKPTAPAPQPIANEAAPTTDTLPAPSRCSESHCLIGEIRVHPKARDRVTPGTPVFIIAKRSDPHNQPVGLPLAVNKLAWAEPLPFELTAKHSIIAASTESPWDEVVITVRYDQDADVMTKQPGDITGKARAKAPADGIIITLDDVLP